MFTLGHICLYLFIISISSTLSKTKILKSSIEYSFKYSITDIASENLAVAHVFIPKSYSAFEIWSISCPYAFAFIIGNNSFPL